MKNNHQRRTPLRLVWSERIRRSTPAWQEKLKRIKEQLWQGTYSVKSDDVAKALLRKEKSLSGTKQPIPLRWWRKTRRPPQWRWDEETGDG